MRTKTVILIAALVVVLAVTTVAVANGSVDSPRLVLSGGASAAAAGTVSLRATLGQPVVGAVASAGGTVTLGQGFWGGSWPGVLYRVYLPLVFR
jgi:hypothetical protein